MDLKRLLQANRGRCGVFFHIINGGKKEFVIRSKSLFVPFTDDFLKKVEGILGPESTWVES